VSGAMHALSANPSVGRANGKAAREASAAKMDGIPREGVNS
jgi:hypothetical protein